MKFATRSPRTPEAAKPGLVGTARVERRLATLLPRLAAGDIAVVEHQDLDRGTAQQLLDANVRAVVNAAPMISGRYAPLGPEVLAQAGVTLIGRAGPEVLSLIKDGAQVRLDGAEVYVADRLVATGELLDADRVAAQMQQARTGMEAHLQSFTHNTSEFLRREQDLLLHGRGLPVTRTTVSGRPVVVVGQGHEHRSELKGARRFIRETKPVLIGVDRGAEAILAAGHRPDIVVLSSARPGDPEVPSAKALKAARDVIVRLERGAPVSATAPLRQLGVHPLRLETGATSEDAALILAQRAGAEVIVGVGLRASLEEFLDHQRGGLASSFLTRLAVGPLLVDAAAVPRLYSGRVKPRHLLGLALAGLAAVAAAVATTPVGQDWVDQARPQVEKAVEETVDTVQGWFG